MKNLSLQANLVSSVAMDALGVMTLTAAYNTEGGCKGDLTHVVISQLGSSTYSWQAKNILSTDLKATAITGGNPFLAIGKVIGLDACVQYAALDETGMDFSTDYIIISGVPSESANLFYIFTYNEDGDPFTLADGNTLYTTGYLQAQTNFANADLANPNSMPATTSKSPSVTVCTIQMPSPEVPVMKGVAGGTVEYIEDYVYQVTIPYTAASVLRLAGAVLALPQNYFTGVVVFEEPVVTQAGLTFKFKLVAADGTISALSFLGIVLTIETTNQTW